MGSSYNNKKQNETKRNETTPLISFVHISSHPPPYFSLSQDSFMNASIFCSCFFLFSFLDLFCMHLFLCFTTHLPNNKLVIN